MSKARCACLELQITALALLPCSTPYLEVPGSLQNSFSTPSTGESKTLQSCTSASTASPSPAGFHRPTLFSQRLHPLLQRWLRYSNELISRGNEFNYLSLCQNWDVWPEIFQAACQPKDGLGSWLKTEQQFLRIIRKQDMLLLMSCIDLPTEGFSCNTKYLFSSGGPRRTERVRHEGKLRIYVKKTGKKEKQNQIWMESLELSVGPTVTNGCDTGSQHRLIQHFGLKDHLVPTQLPWAVHQVA